MNVTLSEQDRIVMEYHGATSDGSGRAMTVVLVQNEEVDDVYLVLWQYTQGDHALQLMWRADWKGSVEYFNGLCDDLEHDRNTSDGEPLRELARKIEVPVESYPQDIVNATS